MESLNLVFYLPYALILMGVIFILISVFHKPGVERLTKIGERCEGIIFKLDYGTDRHNNDSLTKGKITVRFVTQKQEWITEDLNTDFMITWTGQFKEGQAVPILYDPNNPSDFTIETKQSPQAVKIVFILIGFVLLGMGIYKLIEP